VKVGGIKPKVKLLAYLHSDIFTPEDLVVFGAYATLKKEDPEELYHKILEERRLEKHRERVLNVTLESGHLSVLDQAVYTFIIRDLPRVSTLFLVQPIYLSHLQQSMRRVEPYGIYVPDDIKDKNFKKYAENAINLYYKMVDSGIPKEDARYVIPLYTVTNIQTVGNARELTYLKILSEDEGVPTVSKNIVKKIIDEASKKSPNLFRKWGENYNILRYYPAPNLFRKPYDNIDKFIDSHKKKVKYVRARLYSYSISYKIKEKDVKKALQERDKGILTLLRNNTYNLILKMSIAALHQALRQRTWNHIPESIYSALDRFEYVIPPSIKRSKFNDEYNSMVKKLYKTYISLIKEGYPYYDAIGIVSHSHIIYDLIRIDGWNILSTIPIRRCLKAQWEIRFISSEITNEIMKVDSVTGKYSLPSCITLGECPEKYPCEYVDKFIKLGPLIK